MEYILGYYVIKVKGMEGKIIMTMEENLSEKLKNKRKELRLSQGELAKIIGVDQKTISHWENGINEPQLNKLRIFCDNFKVPISYFTGNDILQNDDFISIDFYNDVYASCGKGGLISSADKETLTLPANFISVKMQRNKRYSIVRARGNSMVPEILDGDLILIEHHDGEQIIDNSIYLFTFDNEVFVKRLSKNINEIIITSENKDYPQVILRGSDIDKLQIIGKVFGFSRKYS